MAAITGFTGTILKSRKIDASTSFKENLVSLQAGNGSLTYPTGGIPVALGDVGMVANLEAILFVDFGPGTSNTTTTYVPKYNSSTQKIQLYIGAGSAILAELANTAVPNVTIIAYAKGY